MERARGGEAVDQGGVYGVGRGEIGNKTERVVEGFETEGRVGEAAQEGDEAGRREGARPGTDRRRDFVGGEEVGMGGEGEEVRRVDRRGEVAEVSGGGGGTEMARG